MNTESQVSKPVLPCDIIVWLDMVCCKGQRQLANLLLDPCKRTTGESPAEGYEDDEGTGTSLL